MTSPQLQNQTRRLFLQKSGYGLGAAALTSLMHRDAAAALDPLARLGMHHAPNLERADRLQAVELEPDVAAGTFRQRVGAEERGQAEAIARNLREMAGFRVPIIVFVTGEGGSGGALAIAVSIEILGVWVAFTGGP